MIDTIPPETVRLIHSTKHYIVERARTARRFIKQTMPPYSIDELQIIEIPREGQSHLQQLAQWCKEGLHVGVMSESGMPAVADPGNRIVAYAHSNKIKVKVASGPSSIIMALAASGLNGQNFAFNGYLPIKEHELRKCLKSLENKILKEKQCQIFIEVPYRNDRMFQFLIKELRPDIKLCIARDITGEFEFISTVAVSEWKKQNFKIQKHPTIFILG